MNPNSVEFQDIPHNTSSQYSASSDSQSLLNGPGPGSSGLSSNSSEGEPENFAAAPYYSITYYRQFFDVNTDDILNRFKKTLLIFSKFYDPENTQDKPDLYGPFWICTTLVFLLAATANFSDYVATSFIDSNSNNNPVPSNQTLPTSAAPSESSNPVAWHYDFRKVSLSASIFYFWLFAMPVIVYCLLSRMNQQKGIVETISIYGYSLIYYLPATLLCLIPNTMARWIIVGLAFGFSSFFTVFNLFPVNGDGVDKAKAYPILAFIVGSNFILAIITKLLFFVN